MAPRFRAYFTRRISDRYTVTGASSWHAANAPANSTVRNSPCKICAKSRCHFLLKFQWKTRKTMQFNGNNANNYEKCIHKVVSCYNFLQIPRISMDFCILHGNFFQNWFPGFAHILHVGFLTVWGLCSYF